MLTVCKTFHSILHSLYSFMELEQCKQNSAFLISDLCYPLIYNPSQNASGLWMHTLL